jgi:UDP-glucose 4-epimerase
MNILVTGGAGYIGTALSRSLLRQGHTVRVLDLQQPTLAQLQASCEYNRGDLLDSEVLISALEDVEAVYHLAWCFFPEDYRREVEENLLGTLNLLDACKAARVSHFIFASSAVVYGPTGIEPACELDPCHPQRSTIGGPVYAITKLACEYYCLASQREGLAVTIMRIHGVFSQDRLVQFSSMIKQAKEKKDIVAVAQAGGPYAHLDDIVWALREVLGMPLAQGEVFNLAGSQIYRDGELAEYIAGKTRTSSKVILMNDPGQAMVSVSVEKLSTAIGYQPRKTDFLREFIDAQFPYNKG